MNKTMQIALKALISYILTIYANSTRIPKKAGSKVTDGAKSITSKAVDGVKGVGSKVGKSVDIAKGKVTKLTQFKPKK